MSHVSQVDTMLQTLEKEIDDVDAKIGDRWRLLDRFLHSFMLAWENVIVIYSIF